MLPLMQAKMPPRVNTGAWQDSQGQRHPVMICVTPCMGMLHPNWAAETMEAGATGAMMVTCPDYDCAFREGPHWVDDRMKRRRTLRKGNTYFLELAPGSRQEVASTWAAIIGDEQGASSRPPVTVVGLVETIQTTKQAWLPQARALVAGFVLLLATFAMSLLVDLPASATLPEQAQMRLVINHGGKLMTASVNLSPEVLAKLPKNVDPAMVLGGERFPVQVRLTVDGQLAWERSYRPRGLRREGAIYALESWWLSPGQHQVEIALMDDGATWQLVFSGNLEVSPGESKTLYFDSAKYAFVTRE
jgi:hypothetical protein